MSTQGGSESSEWSLFPHFTLKRIGKVDVEFRKTDGAISEPSLPKSKRYEEEPPHLREFFKI